MSLSPDCITDTAPSGEDSRRSARPGVIGPEQVDNAQFSAWIGALLNTARPDDKTWFVVLLLIGVLSFGFMAMLLYVIAEPDGTTTKIEGSAIAVSGTTGT
jgi:hypothetical protein